MSGRLEKPRGSPIGAGASRVGVAISSPGNIAPGLPAKRGELFVRQCGEPFKSCQGPPDYEELA